MIVIKVCLNIKKKCENTKNKLVSKVKKFKRNNLKIAGYAATSKSTTILNYCKIGTNYIEYICDTTKEKIGKFSPGMHIPIVNMNYFKRIFLIKPFFCLDHKKEIFKKKRDLQTKKNGLHILKFK